ncbi:hypothetical protein Q7Z28_09660 [Glaesserella parasuis]|uniref:hypothetical protein n=1 Tax=Glaesserella parasuis TaxID=738 RepID=UPI0003AC0081|nr:hypothetical protein [Glaesserella parasuis]ATW44092.1 hypothetical protein A2U20_10030 [Glaesserella parasuis D74]EQA11005.1 hypothetical protein HPSD74_0709 [Glaesserella parasuis D74]MDP0318406.1 hypothetical protein [Glaesserella parasuis]
MKKLLVSLAAMTIATNVLAESNLVQAKLDTLAKIYHKSGINNPYGHLEKYVTPDFKMVIAKAKKHDKSEEDFDSLCLGGYTIYGAGQDWDPSQPKFKVAADKVQMTAFRMKNDKNTKVTLKYSFECTDNQCLVSDFITENGYSFKKLLAQCAM